jgi:hypothetical protein
MKDTRFLLAQETGYADIRDFLNANKPAILATLQDAMATFPEAATWFIQACTRYGLGNLRDVARFAILSADTDLDTNARLYRQGKTRFGYQRTNIALVESITSGNPEDYLAAIATKPYLLDGSRYYRKIAKGARIAPKTVRFFLNLTGDTSLITVDQVLLGWFGFSETLQKAIFANVSVYNDMCHTLEEMALEFGLAPAIFQSYLWVWIRGQMF